MKKYLVETVSIFRIRYVIEAEEKEHASDEVVCNNGNLKELSQLHIDEDVLSVREIDDSEYIKIFNEDNEYLITWTDKHKFGLVNTINYSK